MLWEERNQTSTTFTIHNSSPLHFNTTLFLKCITFSTHISMQIIDSLHWTGEEPIICYLERATSAFLK